MNLFECKDVAYFPLAWLNESKTGLHTTDERENPYEEYLNGIGGADWIRYGTTPRKEIFIHKDQGATYTYGKPGVSRTYKASTTSFGRKSKIFSHVKSITGVNFNALFANQYEDGRDHLGWHADDGEQIDQTKPIAVFSFGEAREIWIKPKPHKLDSILATAPEGFVYELGMEVTKILLEDKSLLLMAEGMQNDWYHRIPKSSKHDSGGRISLTFRVMKDA